MITRKRFSVVTVFPRTLRNSERGKEPKVFQERKGFHLKNFREG